MSTIGITMGCPASIGPELLLKYFSEYSQTSDLTPVVLGDIGILKLCAQSLGFNDLSIKPWNPGEDIPARGKKSVPVLPLSSLSVKDLKWGHPNIETAKSMASYITEGVKLCQDGVLDGITTCPISKHSLNEAGYNYPGHTEMLADLTHSSNFAMMMAGSRLKVTLVTIHTSIANVPDLLTIESICQMIATTHHALTVDLGIAHPRIAVAALNPHGGEKQLFGFEEKTTIEPAIAVMKEKGINASGPYPPDTVFYKAAHGEYDAVVCMYHDQGLIPFKILHFEDGVNVTLGLPIVRTSVDHGTAYDIAGKGIANPTSLTQAVELAGAISRNRRAYFTAKGSLHG